MMNTMQLAQSKNPCGGCGACLDCLRIERSTPNGMALAVEEGTCTTHRESQVVCHKLKTWPNPFRAVIGTLKKHEFRKNDRCFVAGDDLLLQEWDPEAQQYTGAEVLVRVTYISEGGSFGIPEGYCVMSIEIQRWCLPEG